MDFINEVFNYIVEGGIILLELAGVGVLLVTAVKSIIGCFKRAYTCA